MDLMKIYNKSPIFVQNILTSLQGLLYKRQRYGKEYYKHKKAILKRDYSDPESISKIQEKLFLDYIKYAVNYSPFYKESYTNIDISQIKSLGDLSKLPILDKETLRTNISNIYAHLDKSIIMSTSGTTGKTINILVSLKDLQHRMAYLDAFKEKHGFINLKMKRATFNSSKIIPPNNRHNIFSRSNFFMKQRIYSGYHCNYDNIKYYIEDLNKYKPDSIDGLPSVIYKIAKYIVDNNIKLSFHPIAIFPTAETLLPHYRSAIETAFKCKIYDQYSSTEASPFIVECKHGNLHYRKDTGIIERTDTGQILVTCFYSNSTPLIRYNIGDVVGQISESFCNCGDKSPIVENLQGRSTDYLVTETGDHLSSLFLSLVSQSFDNCIIEMQFVQNTRNSILVNVVADDRFNSDMSNVIINKLNYSMGKSMNITVKRVNHIDKKGAKHPLIINNLREEGVNEERNDV